MQSNTILYRCIEPISRSRGCPRSSFDGNPNRIPRICRSPGHSAIIYLNTGASMVTFWITIYYYSIIYRYIIFLDPISSCRTPWAAVLYLTNRNREHLSACIEAASLCFISSTRGFNKRNSKPIAIIAFGYIHIQGDDLFDRLAAL